MILGLALTLLVLLILKVARDQRAYRRAWRAQRTSFERHMDEIAARSALGYSQDAPRLIAVVQVAPPASVVKDASPQHGAHRGGTQHEREFDGLQGTTG